MNTKRNLNEIVAIQKKIEKLKEKYSIRDFTDNSYHCKKILFYVPETNRFYGFDNLPYEYSSFIKNGGMALLNINNAQEFNIYKIITDSHKPNDCPLFFCLKLMIFLSR